MNGPEIALATPGPADGALPPKPAPDPGFQPFGDDGPTFWDLLDVVNPLQHIPVVAAVYRYFTGDEIDPVPKVAGGALFGGIIGAVASVADVVLEEATGRDAGEHAMALLGDDEGGDIAPFAVAENEPPILPAPVATEPLPAVTGAVVAGAANAGVADHADVLAWARRERAWAAETAAAGRYREAEGLAGAPARRVDVVG